MKKYELSEKQNEKLSLIAEVAGLKPKKEEGIGLLNEIMDMLEDTDIITEKQFKKLPMSIQNFYNAVADIDLTEFSKEDAEKLDEAFKELSNLKGASNGGKEDEEKDSDKGKDKKDKGKKKRGAETKATEEKDNDKDAGKDKGKKDKKDKKTDAKDTREKDFPTGSKVDYAGKKEALTFKGGEVVGYHTWPATGVIVKLKDGTKRAITPKALTLATSKKK